MQIACTIRVARLVKRYKKIDSCGWEEIQKVVENLRKTGIPEGGLVNTDRFRIVCGSLGNRLWIVDIMRQQELFLEKRVRIGTTPHPDTTRALGKH
jgi:hypothetical protein